MSDSAYINTSLLEGVKQLQGKIVARCPVCAQSEGDKHKDNFVLHDNGRFSCSAGCDTKAIFVLVGVTAEPTPEKKRQWVREKARVDDKIFPPLGSLSGLKGVTA